MTHKIGQSKFTLSLTSLYLSEYLIFMAEIFILLSLICQNYIIKILAKNTKCTKFYSQKSWLMSMGQFCKFIQINYNFDLNHIKINQNLKFLGSKLKDLYLLFKYYTLIIKL